MAKSKTQRMKEYRARKKASIGEDWLKQERKRTKQYYKPTAERNRKDEKVRRERIRDNVAAYRKRQKALLNNTDDTIPVSDKKNPLVSKEDENGVSSTSSAQPLVVQIPMISARFKGGKKRASHALTRKSLRKHYEILQKGQNTLRKRLERERKRHREVIDTPRRKTDSLMRKAGLKLGTRATESIRKKLLYAECISKEAAEASEVNPAKKRLVGKVSGKIMKKYKMLTELKQSTNITWRTQAKQSKKLDQERQHRNLFLRQKNCQRC